MLRVQEKVKPETNMKQAASRVVGSAQSVSESTRFLLDDGSTEKLDEPVSDFSNAIFRTFEALSFIKIYLHMNTTALWDVTSCSLVNICHNT
jgi:hypothetical protein